MVADNQTKKLEPEASQNEFIWVLRRFLLLLRYWTTPLDTAVRIPAEDQSSVRAFALFLIVALTFAIRADPSGGNYAAVTAMAAGVAAFLSAVLNTVSDQFKLRIREQVIISAYASTISVMFLYIFVDNYFSGIFWYEALNDQFGKSVVTVFLAVVISYSLLVAKAFLIERHKFTVAGVVHGACLVIGSGLIVVCISRLSTPTFKLIIQMMNHAVG
jgi:hypothetical protein